MPSLSWKVKHESIGFVFKSYDANKRCLFIHLVKIFSASRSEQQTIGRITAMEEIIKMLSIVRHCYSSVRNVGVVGKLQEAVLSTVDTNPPLGKNKRP